MSNLIIQNVKLSTYKLDDIIINNINIITSRAIDSIALNIKHILSNTVNANINILYELTEDECNKSTFNDMYIILFTNKSHNLMPKRHIMYQIEQLKSPFFNDTKLYNLSKAEYIWEFSIINSIKYNKVIKKNKLIFVPVPFYYYNRETIPFNNCKYDILFYGTMNKRRYNILNELNKKYSIKCVTTIIGEDRDKLINESKIIINLHYYDFATLETTRCHEVLQYNKIILSENTKNKNSISDKLYDNLVIFFNEINENLDNINELYTLLDYYLVEENYTNYISNINRTELRTELINKSQFFIHKALYTIPGIQLKKEYIEYDIIPNTMYCLSLAETPDRLLAFKKQNIINNFESFPGVKNITGWIGCGLSYKTLIYNAKRCNIEKITIFEDDCKLKDDFYKKYEIINEMLDLYKNWDVFVGCIADCIPETQIKNIIKYKGLTFLELDRFTSGVFNIYNNTSYDNIINWNSNNIDVHNNAIDRYLSLKHMRIIIMFPYLVSCLSVQTTLWNSGVTDYSHLFVKSINILQDKINKYTGNIIEL